jgi:hypothetical protein
MNKIINMEKIKLRPIGHVPSPVIGKVDKN